MNKNGIFAGLCTLAFASSVASGQPAISNVTVESNNSGSQLVRISGAQFGNGPNVVLYDDFEKGSDGEDIDYNNAQIGSWDGTFHGGTPRYYQQPSGNLAHRIRDHQQLLSNNYRIANLVRRFPSPQTHAVIAFSVMVPDGTTFAGSSQLKTFPDRSSWKFTWLVSEFGIGNDDKFDMCLPTHIGNGNFLLAGNNGNLDWMSGGDNWWSWGAYNHITSEVRIDPISPSTSPVAFSYQIVSPVAVTSEKGTQDPSEFAGTDYQFDRILIPGWWGNGDNSNFDALYDNVYIAVGENARARIVVTDNEIFQDSTSAITLPAESWTDSRIEINAELLPDNEVHFIHIVDSNGNMTSNGYKLCPRCANPPTPTIQ